MPQLRAVHNKHTEKKVSAFSGQITALEARLAKIRTATDTPPAKKQPVKKRRNQNDHTRRHRVQQVGQREPLKQKLFQQHDKTYQRRRSTDSAAGIAKGFPHPAATSVGRAAAGLPWHRGLFGRRW